MVLFPVTETTGFGETVRFVVGSEIHPVIFSVKVKNTTPAVIPVTIPEPFTLAIAGLEDVHVPPTDGVSCVVLPTQIVLLAILTVGLGYMVTFVDGKEAHPVLVCVKVKFTEPADIPVIKPALFIVALVISLEDHDPPDAGSIFVVVPIQIPEGPARDIEGLGFTITGVVGNEGQPPLELVNVKVACPWEIPITMPLLFTEATAGLLLTQIPPE